MQGLRDRTLWDLMFPLELDEDSNIVVKLPDGVRSRDGLRGYMRLQKALSVFELQLRRGPLLKKLCELESCETEPCLFAGTVLGNQKVVVLCYVDDLLITGESDEAIYHVVEQLKVLLNSK